MIIFSGSAHHADGSCYGVTATPGGGAETMTSRTEARMEEDVVGVNHRLAENPGVDVPVWQPGDVAHPMTLRFFFVFCFFLVLVDRHSCVWTRAEVQQRQQQPVFSWLSHQNLS